MNIEYIKSGDYYIAKLKPSGEMRSIGKLGGMHSKELIYNG